MFYIVRYEFEAYPSGTHYYHSHAGLQSAEGIFGPLIVHSNVADDPVYDLYDHNCEEKPHAHCEHVVTINNWMTKTYTARYIRSLFSLSKRSSFSIFSSSMNNFFLPRPLILQPSTPVVPIPKKGISQVCYTFNNVHCHRPV